MLDDLLESDNQRPQLLLLCLHHVTPEASRLHVDRLTIRTICSIATEANENPSIVKIINMRLSTLALLLAVQSASARKNAKPRQTLEVQTADATVNYDSSHLGDVIDDLSGNDTDGLADDLGALDDQVQQEIQDLESELSKLEELLEGHEGQEGGGADEPDVCDQDALAAALLTTCDDDEAAYDENCEVKCEECPERDCPDNFELDWISPLDCSSDCVCEEPDCAKDGKIVLRDFQDPATCDFTCVCPVDCDGDLIHNDDCECVAPDTVCDHACTDGEKQMDDCSCVEKVRGFEKVKAAKPLKAKGKNKI